MSIASKAKPTVRSFRDLRAWQEANAMVVIALRIADALPAGYAFLADQLRRASTSVPLNVAEGNGKRSRREYVRFLHIARGSLNEVEAAAYTLRASRLAPSADVGMLLTHVAHTGRLLSALITSLEEQPTTPVPRLP